MKRRTSLGPMVPTSKAASMRQIADATEMEAVVVGTEVEEVGVATGEADVEWVAVLFPFCFVLSNFRD